jgi:hypothetical protein
VVNTKQIVIGVLVVAAFAALVIWLMPDEKKAIRKQFARLSELAGKKGDESLFVTAAQARALAELLTDPCELKGNMHSLGGTYSRQEAATAVAAIRTQFNTMALDLVDLTIELPEKNKAKVTLTAKLNASGSGERVSEVRELDCTLLKQDGKWLFNACQVVEVFQKK